MVNIKLVIIGHSDKIVKFDAIKQHKSNFFRYSDIVRINNLPDPQKDDGYLDVVYSEQELALIMDDIEFDGLCFAIMNYSYDDGFYLHRVGHNKACLSIYGLEGILSSKKISIENFIIKNIYEVFIFYNIFKNITEDEKIYKVIHNDTRGCLFDMNGDKSNIIYNTEKPIICDECKGKISRYPISKNFLKEIEKELSKIDKPYVKKVENFIAEYPLVSLLSTFIFSTVINLFSNWLWKLI